MTFNFMRTKCEVDQMRRIKRYITFLFLAVLTCQSLTSFRTDPVRIEEPIPFKKLTFYISGIKDLRDIKGNELKVLKKYIADNLPNNQSLKPIVIDIKELTVTETPGKPGMVNGEIKMALSFSLQKSAEPQHLLNYNGGMKYSRVATNKTVVEQHLTQISKSSLSYFDKWMSNNISTNKIFATAVKFHFKEFKDELDGDTIYYSSKRPLTWSDFKSKIKRSNKYAAMVMPNFGYDQEEKIENGVIQVSITLQTFLAKSDCWLGSSYKDNYMLNHEQRHFDIAKIVTDQFKTKLLNADLSPENYEALVNMQYLESYRDMNKLQKAYDTETSHGLNNSAQYNWNKRIDGLLAGENTIAQNL